MVCGPEITLQGYAETHLTTQLSVWKCFEHLNHHGQGPCSGDAEFYHTHIL